MLKVCMTVSQVCFPWVNCYWIKKDLVADVMRLSLKIRFYIVILLVREGRFHKMTKLSSLM